MTYKAIRYAQMTWLKDKGYITALVWLFSKILCDTNLQGYLGSNAGQIKSYTCSA